MTLGLRDLFYAVCTEADGVETYGTPKKMAEAMTADLSVKTADGSLYTWGSGSSYGEEKPLLYPQSENIPVKSELTDVVSVHLGAYGGGAALTEEAEALLSAYQALREEVAAFARERFETRFRDL